MAAEKEVFNVSLHEKCENEARLLDNLLVDMQEMFEKLNVNQKIDNLANLLHSNGNRHSSESQFDVRAQTVKAQALEANQNLQGKIESIKQKWGESDQLLKTKLQKLQEVKSAKKSSVDEEKKRIDKEFRAALLAISTQQS